MQASQLENKSAAPLEEVSWDKGLVNCLITGNSILYLFIYLDIKIIAVCYLIKSAFSFSVILLNVTACVLQIFQTLKVENTIESWESNFDKLPGVLEPLIQGISSQHKLKSKKKTENRPT